MRDEKRRWRRRAPESSGVNLANGLLAAISPKLAAAKAAAKLAAMLAMAKLRSNFRKWNRKDYGERDNER